MVRERTKPNGRPNWEELSPALREAVKRVCCDPLPEAVARRASQAAARQIARLPDNPAPRFVRWTVPIVAASVLLLGMATAFWAVRSAGVRVMTEPPSPTASLGVAQPNDENLHTAGAYAQAARLSPEALLSQMDRQSQRSQSGKSRPTIQSSIFSIPSIPGTSP